MRALHQTDWTTAEQCIKQSLAFSKHKSEPLFLKLQLYLAQGNDQEAAEICEELAAMHEKLSELDKVRSYLYQAEVFCLSANYPGTFLFDCLFRTLFWLNSLIVISISIL